MCLAGRVHVVCVYMVAGSWGFYRVDCTVVRVCVYSRCTDAYFSSVLKKFPLLQKGLSHTVRCQLAWISKAFCYASFPVTSVQRAPGTLAAVAARRAEYRGIF